MIITFQRFLSIRCYILEKSYEYETGALGFSAGSSLLLLHLSCPPYCRSPWGKRPKKKKVLLQPVHWEGPRAQQHPAWSVTAGRPSGAPGHQALRGSNTFIPSSCLVLQQVWKVVHAPPRIAFIMHTIPPGSIQVSCQGLKWEPRGPFPHAQIQDYASHICSNVHVL